MEAAKPGVWGGQGASIPGRSGPCRGRERWMRWHLLEGRPWLCLTVGCLREAVGLGRLKGSKCALGLGL